MNLNFLGKFDTSSLVFPGILTFHYLAQPLKQAHAFEGHEWILRPEGDGRFCLQTREGGVFLYYDKEDKELLLMSGWPERDHRITVWPNGDAEYFDQHVIYRENDREETLEVQIATKQDFNCVMLSWQQNLYEGGSVSNAIADLLRRNNNFAGVLPHIKHESDMVEFYARLQREQLERIPSNVLREYGISSSGDQPFSQEIAEQLEADYLPNGNPSIRTPLNLVGIRYIQKKDKKQLQAIWRTRQGLGKLPANATKHLMNFFGNVPSEALQSSGDKLTGVSYPLESCDTQQILEFEESWVMLRHYRDIATKAYPVFDRLMGWWEQYLEKYPEEDELWIEPAS